MIVGQPLKILVAFSTAIVECQCDAKTVLSLHGLNKPASCPACAKVYAIASAGVLRIGEILNAPEAPRVSLT